MVAGALCAVFVPGVAGEILTFALVAGGLAAAVLLAFLEVGLQEDRDRARDEADRRKRAMLGFGTGRRLRNRFGGRPRRPG